MTRLVLAVLALAACGDDGSGGSIAVDDLGLELALVSCEKQFDCCTDAEIMEQYMNIMHDGHPIETEAQCVEFGNAVFSGFAITQYKESIAEGRMEYDGAAAADCVAALQGLTCATYNTPELSIPTLGCRPFLIPKVANDGACTQDYECTSGNCEGAANPIGQPSTDGACKPVPAAGQPCDDNCADGYYCGSDLQSSDVCLALKSNGTECLRDAECASDFCDDTCAIEPKTCDGR